MATSPVAAMLLEILVDELEPSQLIVSTLRHSRGPALLAAQAERAPARSADRGGALTPAAASIGSASMATCSMSGSRQCSTTSPKCRRLRLASCLLADVAWQANPDFRADRGIEMALHGNWVAVNPAGRVIMAQALSSNFGRDRLPDSATSAACASEEQLERAHCWGLAMRLGQRLSGGVGTVLKRTSLSANDGTIQLHVRRGEEALIGDAGRAAARAPRGIVGQARQRSSAASGVAFLGPRG